ncbi:MAG: hypothetical protein JXA64_08200 [Candidatus Fermentibacteraceae bacterium]|nr:hypothetical protein [Candidatus Fermentibacteraceae bacterium]MBN2609081.1 hypothetical protein [Candidatus Fermentibacteraceae bacterium]
MTVIQRGTGSRLFLSSVVCVSLLISLSVFHPYPYDNVVTRWGLAERLVASGSIRIDEWAFLTGDKAEYQGHYYSDKSFLPSAVAALAVLPLKLSDCIDGPGEYPVGGAGRYAAERLTVTLAFLLLLFLLRKKGEREGEDPVLPVLAAGLGSILLPYSTLLYTHVPAALLIFSCYCAQSRGRFLASDVLGGLAVAYEYTLVLPFLVLLAYRDRSYWSATRAARAALLPVLVFIPQLVHNWIAFDNPLSMGYGLEAEGSFPVVSRGFFGFTFPSFHRLYLILLSPERGILFYMPWAVLGLWGLMGGSHWRRRVRSDPLPVLVLSYILLYSAQNAATAGWAYGQRYLIPMIPFLALGLGRFSGGSAGRRSAAALAILPGVVISLLGVFGEVHMPVHPVENPVPLPQMNISLSMMLSGHHSTWLLGSIGAVTLSTAAVVCSLILIRRSGFRLAGLAWLPIWLILAVISQTEDWGGRIDYYRGILAQHRGEWELAAGYYGRALEDENAPEVVRTRLIYVRSQAGAGGEGTSVPRSGVD